MSCLMALILDYLVGTRQGPWLQKWNGKEEKVKMWAMNISLHPIIHGYIVRIWLGAFTLNRKTLTSFVITKPRGSVVITKPLAFRMFLKKSEIHYKITTSISENRYLLLSGCELHAPNLGLRSKYAETLHAWHLPLLLVYLIRNKISSCCSELFQIGRFQSDITWRHFSGIYQTPVSNKRNLNIPASLAISSVLSSGSLQRNLCNLVPGYGRYNHTMWWTTSDILVHSLRLYILEENG